MSNVLSFARDTLLTNANNDFKKQDGEKRR